ncbi:MAG: FtsX-like permease family protein [Bacillota bacterium]|jgi:putative ABC transport system permease protein
MNVTHRLTLRHLKLNKSRTLVTIIGVVLSVAMLTAVTNIVASARDMFIRMVIETDGNWHAYFHKVPADKLDVFLDSQEVNKVMFSSELGYAPLEASGNPNKPYWFIHQYDEAGFENLTLTLLEGRFPANSTEIVVPEHVLYNGEADIAIGDKLELTLGQRYADPGQEYRLDQTNPYQPEEVFASESTRVYTVVGIIRRPLIEEYSSPGYSAFTLLDAQDIKSIYAVNVYVQFQKVSRALYGISEELADRAGMEKGDRQIAYNRDLLGLYGVSDSPFGRKVLSALFLVAAIVIAIIMVGSISLIYNAFAISLSERSRHLGMLASVGATKAQKRRLVLFEGLIISIISIPVGLLAGTAGIGITFAAVSPLLETVFASSTSLRLVVSPISIVAAIACSLLTIFISTWIPARRAAKISPIDAIRQSRDIKLSGKKVRTSKLTRRLFGFEAELGLKNLKRYRRRYRTTVVSLSISIILYLTVAAFAAYAGLSAEMLSEDIIFDIVVNVESSAAKGQEIYQRIAQLDLVDKYAIEHIITGHTWVDAAKASDFVAEKAGPEGKGYRYEVRIQSLDAKAFAQYLRDNGIKMAATGADPKGILINKARTRDYDNLKIIDTEVIKAEVGDTFIVDHGSDQVGKISIAAITDQPPIGTSIMFTTETIVLVVSEEDLGAYAEMLDNPEFQSAMYIISSAPEVLENDIRRLHKADFRGTLNLYNYAKHLQNQRNMLTLLSVFTTGFIVLITGICIANIMNTISTSIALRRREFAMLKSVGLTPKGFARMLRFESIFYGIKALSIGLPLSLAINYLLFRSMGGAFEFPFILPWGNYLIAIVAVFVVVFVTMLYFSARVKKENIVDTLKDENL